MAKPIATYPGSNASAFGGDPNLKPYPNVMGKILNVRVSEDIAKRLEYLATKTKRPKGFYVKEILEEHLAEYEDSYLALERLNDKNAKYYTSETVEEILGLSSEVA